MRPIFRRAPIGGAVAAVLVLGASSPGLAQSTSACPVTPGHSICFSRIDAEYSVLRSGDVIATERFVVRFNGDWNGMTRELIESATSHDLRPVEEREADPDSTFRDVDIDILGATDGSGRELDIDRESTGDAMLLRIWVPGAHDAERTVELRYRIEDGVTFFADHDEFYWNALGTSSTAPVRHMTVRVIPPEGTTGLRVDAWAGSDYTSRDVTARIDGVMAVASTTAPLGAGRGFTIAAGWDPGVVERPGRAELFLDWLARWWAFALPLVSLVLMYRSWDRRGRDPALLPIVARYEPPADISPGEVGTLLDEKADMRDVTATLVDLAVQGRLEIEEVEGTKVFGLEFGEDFAFVDTTPAAATPPARKHESLLMRALFGGRTRVELSDLKNEFYKDLPDIRTAMMDSLVGHGVYVKRPDHTRALWTVFAFILAVVLFFVLGATGAHYLALIAVPPLTGLPVAIFGYLMPRRTVKGTRLIEQLMGFREFLERVDGDRLRRMNIEPSAFEKLLPYAMALGVEKKWAEAFEGLAHEPPRWYHSTGGHAFNPAVFTASLGRMSTATASTMSSRPSSSGSSGGSGFSGGGMGGGGGGGGVGGF